MHVVHMTYMTYIYMNHMNHMTYMHMWCTHADNQKDNNNISTFSCTHVQIQSKYLQPTLDLFCTSCLKIRRFSFNL